MSANTALYYPNGIHAHSYSPAGSSNASGASANNTKPVIAKKTAEVQVSNHQENTKNTVLPQNIVTEKELSRENTQSAVAGNIYPQTYSLFWWIVGVCALAVVGVASAFFTKQNPLLEPAKNDADSYEIIEETENDKIPF